MTTRDVERQSTPYAPLIYSEASTTSAAVLVLAGDVDLATSAELQRRMGDLVESSRTPVVVVDMSHVRFIDAAAIQVIVSAHAAAASLGRHLYVDGLRAFPARVFAILELDWLRLPHRGAAGAAVAAAGKEER